jgi:hypothetical protein
MKAKKPIKRKKKIQTVELTPFDWGVLADALRRKIDYEKERYMYSARWPGSEGRFEQENEYLWQLMKKLEILSNDKPVPKFIPKFPRF